MQDGSMVVAGEPAAQMVQDSKKSKKSKLLLVIGVIFGVVIIGLVATIIIVNINSTNDNTVSIADIKKDNDAPISDSTLALILKERIDKKMEEDEDYTYDNAVVDYIRAYDETNGKTRAYITMYYADFVYRYTDDANLAVEIMEQFDVKQEVPTGDNVTLMEYYTVLRNYYVILKDANKVKECNNNISELVSSAEPVPMEGTTKETESDDE